MIACLCSSCCERNRRRGSVDDRTHDARRDKLAERADDHVAAQFSAVIAHHA